MYMSQKKRRIPIGDSIARGDTVLCYVRVSKKSEAVKAGDFVKWIEGKAFWVKRVKNAFAELPNLLAGVSCGDIDPGNYGWIQTAGYALVEHDGSISNGDRLI